MAGQRRQRIIERLVGNGTSPLQSRKLCDVSAEVIEVTGAGIMLMSGEVARGSVCSSNAVSALIEELQYELGEGPCVDAHELGHPVLEPHLANPALSRWIAFASPALEAGVRAVFAFPLHVGAIRLGALDLYRDRPGPLSDDQHADALVMADVAAQAVLSLQADASPGSLASALEAGADFHYVVHQASGMIAAQLEVGVAQALIRLRAHAFGHGRSLAEVAQDVVSRQLRFDV